MDKRELDKILEEHKKWLRNKNWGERADLINADLRYADLINADLRYADLRGADLRGANLINADLRNADLRNADLTGANLISVDLTDADLRYADLRNANLISADLISADLTGADLRNADLVGANLVGANLDYSCWPLWCGTKNVKVDLKIIRQLLLHVYCLDNNTEEFKAIKKAIEGEVKKSHRYTDMVKE